MKSFALGAMLLAPSLVAAQADSVFRAMNQPARPFKIAANVYYVGASDLTSYLFTTPNGHILLDGGVVETAPQILANITSLGFNPRDVKILLNSHAHFDHAGGLAALKSATGAKLFAMTGDAEQLGVGGRTTWDGFGERGVFPSVTADSVLRDGSVVTLGGTTLVAHLTPGHTRGCTTWTTAIESGGRTYKAAFMCSASVPGYTLVGNAGYPTIVADYERTFAILDTLPCEFFFAAHGSFFDLSGKAATLRANPGAETNPFVDPQGCRRYVDNTKRSFRNQVARETQKPR